MVKLDEKTRVSLQFNNFYAILVSIVVFAVAVGGWYNSINHKLVNIEKSLARIEKNFDGIHADVVQNHDDIIILKQLADIK